MKTEKFFANAPKATYMSTAPIGLKPESVPKALPEVAMLRRVDIIDSALNVLLSGTARDCLVEGGGALTPAIAAEVETLIRTHDFTRRPIATGLAGHDFALRLVRTTGAAGSFYTIFTERTALRRRLAQLSHRFHLEPEEIELLRLVAGGYPFAEMVRRIEIAPTALRSQLRELEEKVGCIGRKELAALALGTSPLPKVNSPPPASFPGAGSSTYRARRAGNRLR